MIQRYDCTNGGAHGGVRAHAGRCVAFEDYDADVTALRADLAAERARAEREDEAHTRTIEQRDALEEQIEAIYRALGGEGEWCAKLPPEDPPESGDLGADALALAEAAHRAIAQHACSDLAMQTALAHARAAATACRADRDRLRAAIEHIEGKLWEAAATCDVLAVTSKLNMAPLAASFRDHAAFLRAALEAK